MKRLNLPIVLDSFLAAVCAFLLFFTAVRYYTKSAIWGLTFGIFAFFIFGALAFIYIRKRQNQKLTLTKDEREAELLRLHLSLLPESELLKTLLPLVDGGKISGRIIETEDKVFYPIFRMQPLSPDDIAGVIKRKSKKQKVIFCNTLSEQAIKLAKDFDIEYVTGNRIFNRLKAENLLPEKYVFGGDKKRKAQVQPQACRAAYVERTVPYGVQLFHFLSDILYCDGRNSTCSCRYLSYFRQARKRSIDQEKIFGKTFALRTPR